MNHHLVSLRKSLWTILTSVRSCVSVNSFVLSHQISTLKTLWTIGTLIRPLAGVNDSVKHQEVHLDRTELNHCKLVILII